VLIESALAAWYLRTIWATAPSELLGVATLSAGLLVAAWVMAMAVSKSQSSLVPASKGCAQVVSGALLGLVGVLVAILIGPHGGASVLFFGFLAQAGLALVATLGRLSQLEKRDV